jgi:hypothetical protein
MKERTTMTNTTKTTKTASANFARYENAITENPDVADRFGELSAEMAAAVGNDDVTERDAARALRDATQQELGIKVSLAYAASQIDWDLHCEEREAARLEREAEERREAEFEAMRDVRDVAEAQGIEVVKLSCHGQKTRQYRIHIRFSFDGRNYFGKGLSTSPTAALNAALRNAK